MPDYDTTSLAAGVSAGLDRAARSYQNGKIADNIVRVNPEMLQMLGMDKNQFGALSAEDKSGAVTGAITAMGLKAQQAHAQAAASQAAAQTEDTQAQTAIRQQQVSEDTAIGEALKRYGMGPQQLMAGPGAPSAGAIASIMPADRLNYALQTPGLGGKAIPKFVAALNSLGISSTKKDKGLPVGEQHVLADGTVITGIGESNEPNIRPPKAAEGLDIGETLTDKAGNLWVGKGKGNPPEVKLAVDIKKDKNVGDTGRGRSVFLQSAPEMAAKLDNLEETIIKNNGNNPATTWNPAAVAALGQLPFQIVENYNHVVDPHSVNRPEKLEQDMKHLLPMGAGTRMAVTLEAIRNLRTELVNRVRNFNSVEKELPPNLPPSIHNALIASVPGMKVHPDTRFDSEEQARGSGAQTGDVILMRDPASGVYRRARLK